MLRREQYGRLGPIMVDYPPGVTARLGVVLDDHDQINQAIRQCAGYGQPQDESQEPAVEPVAAPDFGAGVRRSVEPPPDMSTLMRAAHYGGWHRSSGGDR